MSHSTALVNELNAAKRLILSAAADGLGIGSLMDIAGLIKT
ncbi:MAG: hypothetical protein ACK4SF_05185 [Algoriphagus aquaeductus]|uniref:Uncharacterized protein n=1 Tax=Algoriphagus aquaeductus TaxID=475299 RepID=A0A326RS66_9BACT|nr:hypothetical protein [Algoriphagus aquaeductus]PZV84446.1 hypothetical protein CLV31_10494 [Algoriphagus aquaeductus]